MKTQSWLSAATLTILFSLAASTTALANFVLVGSEKQPHLVEGLAEVKPRGWFHHDYTYNMEDHAPLTVPYKIKGVKDLRDEEVAYKQDHPRWYKIQMGFKRWNPVLQGAAAVGVGVGSNLNNRGL